MLRTKIQTQWMSFLIIASPFPVRALLRTISPFLRGFPAGPDGWLAGWNRLHRGRQIGSSSSLLSPSRIIFLSLCASTVTEIVVCPMVVKLFPPGFCCEHCCWCHFWREGWPRNGWGSAEGYDWIWRHFGGLESRNGIWSDNGERLVWIVEIYGDGK